MSLFICSINSGSNGNCYFVGDGTDAVLVDAGISCRETERRMKRAGLDLKQVRAVFVSHEHSDHIRGIETLSKKHRLPVYITVKTHASSGLNVNETLLSHFEAPQHITVGGLTVISFAKRHDASEPTSFIIRGSCGTVAGVFTDIGSCCEEVASHFGQCHAAFLESNYDEHMLETGRYPFYLKRRIRGGHGHLSNTEALDIFMRHRSPGLSHILLSHLSRDNNSPELVRDLFLQHASGVHVEVASRYVESPVYEVSCTGSLYAIKKPVAEQMALFG